MLAQIFQQQQTFLVPISQRKHPIWGQYHTQTSFWGQYYHKRVFCRANNTTQTFCSEISAQLQRVPVYLKFETKHRASPIESNGGLAGRVILK